MDPALADPVLLSEVAYYSREGLYRHIQQAALRSKTRHGASPLQDFWCAFSMLLEGSVADARRQFEDITHRDFLLCSQLGTIQAHKATPDFDKEKVQQLEAKMREERRRCGEAGWFHAAAFLWMVGRHEKARDYATRCLKQSPEDPLILTLLGWIDMTSNRDAHVKKSVEYFDRALGKREEKPVPPDCYMGKARFFEMFKNPKGSLELINLTIVECDNYYPALVERCRLQLALQGWDHIPDNTKRILATHKSSFAARQYRTLCTLCLEGKGQETAEKLGDIIELIDNIEPANHKLYWQVARLFCRLASGNQYILQQAVALVERAKSLAPIEADYLTEMGYLTMLQGKTLAPKEADKFYRQALAADETSIQALTGVIWCQILSGELEDAEQQLDFLDELNQSIGKSADLFYLRALLAEKRGDSDVVERLIATEKFLTGLNEGACLSIDHLIKTNPELKMRVAHALMKYAADEGEHAVGALHSCEILLHDLTSKLPGLIEARFLTAKRWQMKGDLTQAQPALKECLRLDSAYVPAILLSAELALKRDDPSECKQLLETGLSHNFQLRDNAHYHLLQGRAYLAQDDIPSAEKALVSAYEVPGVRDAKHGNVISQSLRADVVLELCNFYKVTERQDKAMALLKDSAWLFADTKEDMRMTIARADLLASTSVDEAIAMLRRFTPKDKYYIETRKKMADIFLKQRKDKKAYLKCFLDMTESLETGETLHALGDAYIQLKDPINAIKAYNSAMRLDPRNSILQVKCGKALARTHDYHKAMMYYDAALKTSPRQIELRYDLAMLLVHLGLEEKLRKMIKGIFEEEKGDSVESLQERVRYMLLNADCAVENGANKNALEHLADAKNEQAKVLQALKSANLPKDVDTEKMADICCKSGDLYIKQKDNEAAVRLFQEALMFFANYERASVALAELYLAMDNLDACHQHCSNLLRTNKDHEKATMMLGDVQLRKLQYDSATFYFEQVLEKNPCNYSALERLIDVMRRLGKLNEVAPFMKKAEKQQGSSTVTPPGLALCQSLHLRGMCEYEKALAALAPLREDSEWQGRAHYEILQIILFFDAESLGTEVLATVDTHESDADGKGDGRRELELQMIRKQLKNWKPTTEEDRRRYQVMEGFELLKIGGRENSERAVNLFMAILTPGGNEQALEHVPSIVGLIKGYLQLKQTPRARNQMKRISKRQWKFEDAEDLERGWLLLVDHNISAGHLDDANRMLTRILQHNQACSRAWEYRGHMQEKSGNFFEAAKDYENAWRFCNQKNPVIGYKLAFNYLKANRFVDACEVCYKVLEANPKYPRIKKDILDKARALVRW